MTKPKVKLTGADGNVFNLLGLCTSALRQAGQDQQANELRDKVLVAKSYDQALQLTMRYVDVS